jgi:hypothetical protein
MIRIEQDMDISYQDAGPWRSYHLDTYGNSVEELCENATIAEIDQDGGELDCYGYDDAWGEVQKRAREMITAAVSKHA